MTPSITLTVMQPADKANAVAECLPHLQLGDLRAQCAPNAEDEAELMSAARERPRQALTATGIARR
jgi:hypothetical protein